MLTTHAPLSRYIWLAASSWAERVSGAAAALRTLGSPLEFLESIGAIVSLRGLDVCGVQ